ncbi:hypothetical protein ACTA71_006641 [Dictyostelium dimigraforme]
MSTANNNDEASGSSNSTNDFDYRIKAMEEQINKLTSAFTKFVKEPVNIHNDSQETIKDKNETSFDGTDIPSEYMLSDSLLEQYKDLINNQGLLDEELFNFPSNFQVNVAPFGTPEGIVASSSVKNNDIDLLIIEKRINDSLKPLFFMSNILATEKSNVNLEMINYLVESTILLVINAQATISRVRRNNISKEIHGSEVILPIKIKDTPKMFDEEETERSMETMPSVSTTNTTTFGIGEDDFLKFNAYVDITDIPDLEISNVVSNDSSPGSSSPNSPISPRTGYIPGSIDKEVNRINSNSNSTTLETGDYSTFQSHVRSIISTQKAGTSDLLMSSWQPSTLKVYDSSYAKFYSSALQIT